MNIFGHRFLILSVIRTCFIIVLFMVATGCNGKSSAKDKDFVGDVEVSKKLKLENLKASNHDKPQSSVPVIDLIADINFRYHRDGWTFNTHAAQITVDKLIAGNVRALFAAIGNSDGKNRTFKDELKLLSDLVLKSDGKVVFAKSLHELENFRKGDPVKLFILVEGASMLEKATEDELFEYKSKGLSIVGLAGGGSSSLCSSAEFVNDSDNGLTKKGSAFVDKLAKLGIAIDLSRASKKTFYDVISDNGLLAMVSHSAAGFLREHNRNLDDLQILTLKQNGGIIGIVFNPDFLTPGNQNVDYRDVIKHLRHLKRLGAIDAIAIGSDFDGIIPPRGLEDVSTFPFLKDKLLEGGFSNDEINSIFYRNIQTFFKNVAERNSIADISGNEAVRPAEVDCDTVSGEFKGSPGEACNGYIFDNGVTLLSSSRLKLRVHSQLELNYLEIYGLPRTPWQIEAQNLNGDIALHRSVRLDESGVARISLPKNNRIVRIFISPTRPTQLREAVIWGKTSIDQTMDRSEK
ncbi:MAG: membrane dipeptidase [Deltaproteobacteria bacterium]|nr:membrane dipeptidase [Deltaproteobacteria bacterium]